MSAPVKIVLNFILIMIIQLFLLNDIVIKSSITLLGIPAFIPMFYPLIILLLPLNSPGWLSMLLALATGMLMDYFSNTPGMHAAAMVLVAFIRPYLLDLFFQQSVKELGAVVPSLFRMGLGSFLIYCSVAILVHHLFFYTLQIWSFKQILYILLKTILSGVLTLLLVLLSQLLFAQRDIRRT